MKGLPCVYQAQSYGLCKYRQFWITIHSNSWTSKETANFPYSSVDTFLMKPQLKSQIAHDHKKNHQAYGGARGS